MESEIIGHEDGTYDNRAGVEIFVTAEDKRGQQTLDRIIQVKDFAFRLETKVMGKSLIK